MAELKMRNEIGRNHNLMVIEPSRRCVGRCVWCAPELNRRLQAKGKVRDDSDPGTFESTVEKAFGPGYDPTDIVQWGLRNRLVSVFASGVEPFQDIAVAKGVLATAASLKLPLFFQTRGTNWREVWDDILPLRGNAAFYVSLPTNDPRVLKRFEPGTPSFEDRKALILAAVEAGFPVMLAMAPFHPDWCPDPGSFAREVISWGVSDIFFGALHLNQRQKLTITDPVALRLAADEWNPRFVEAAHYVRAVCEVAGVGFEINDPESYVHCLTDIPSPNPSPHRDYSRWPYHYKRFAEPLLDACHADPGEPICITWESALAFMEGEDEPPDQVFAFGRMRELIAIKNLPPQWQANLAHGAPARDYLRAMWNNPGTHGFPGGHPFMRIAVRPDGLPHRDDEGNLIFAMHPVNPDKSPKQVVQDIEDVPFLIYEGTD